MALIWLRLKVPHAIPYCLFVLNEVVPGIYPGSVFINQWFILRCWLVFKMFVPDSKIVNTIVFSRVGSSPPSNVLKFSKN